MQYIAFIHVARESAIGPEEWELFLAIAANSGMFKGGSALGKRYPVGGAKVPDSTNVIDGYMRFDSDDLPQLLTLLESHPCLNHGGTIELREMPRSD